MNKGQALSGDFIVSIAVFMIILAFLLPAFDRLSNQVVQDEERREMETLSLFATDAMLKTQGLPSEWNDTNVLAL
ncbi:MAG: hypothetical protein NT120_03945 [Candidatus Aenigmarchaeota archaeon]|nr:hypothetical protein [Candidatus Aenigmarchaeota archaeon]